MSRVSNPVHQKWRWGDQFPARLLVFQKGAGDSNFSHSSVLGRQTPRPRRASTAEGRTLNHRACRPEGVPNPPSAGGKRGAPEFDGYGKPWSKFQTHWFVLAGERRFDGAVVDLPKCAGRPARIADFLPRPAAGFRVLISGASTAPEFQPVYAPRGRCNACRRGHGIVWTG